MDSFNGGVSVAAWERIDGACDAFEAAWRGGKSPSIEEFLRQAADLDRTVLLRELLLLEIGQLRQSGQSPTPHQYHARFPEDAAVVDQAFAPGTRRGSQGDAATLPPSVSDPNAMTLPPVGGGFLGTGGAASNGRFRIVRLHARGGLGEVYVAEDSELHREVALKEIQERFADDPNSRSRFLAEAEITGGLEHPGIVPVYALGHYENGRPYYAMRFIRGDSLKDAIDQFHRGADIPVCQDSAGKKACPTAGFDTLAFRKLLGSFLAVCNAMEYAHSRGVLHRDLKPANIMLGKHGETLVVDWGLAKAVNRPDAARENGENTLLPTSASGSAPTQMGAAVGTPQYMSPEQAEGQLDRLGPASDVYSLGATLYCLLTGQAPFSGELISLLSDVAAGKFIRPRQLIKYVSPGLEAICLKAMSLRFEDRYASARGLADDIEHWLADEPVIAHRESLPARLSRWSRRHRTWIQAAAASLVLILLLTAGYGVLMNRLAADNARLAEKERKSAADNARLAAAEKQSATEANQRRAEAETARQAAEAAQGALAKEKEQKVQELYATQISLAYQEWLNNNVWRAEQLLDATPNELRDWEWRYLKGLCHAEEMTLQGHSGVVKILAYEADGKHLISAGMDVVHRWKLSTNEKVQTRQGKPLAVSPDGRWAAGYLSDDPATVNIRAIDGSSDRKPAPGRNNSVVYADFSGDGKRVAMVDRNGTVRVWDAEKGEEVLRIDGPDRLEPHHVTLSADAKLLACKTRDGWVAVYDALSGERLHHFREDEGNATIPMPVAISDDGRMLATGNHRGEIHLYDAASARKLATLRGHRGPVLALDFSRDGKRLASVSYDQTARIWDVEDPHELLVLRGHRVGLANGVYAVAFSPDGDHLATAGADTTIKIWDTRQQQAAALHGRIAVTEGAATARPRRDPSLEYITFQQHEGAVQTISFSPDGRRIASASWDGTVRLFDPMTGQQTLVFDKHDQGVGVVAFSPDATQIASASGTLLSTKPGKILIWDPETGAVLHELSGHTTPIAGIALLPGQRLVSAGGSQSAPLKGELKWWDLSTGKELFSAKDIALGVRALAASPDGRLLATGDHDGQVKIWNADTGELLRRVGTANVGFFALSFSPDGTMLAGGGTDMSVRTWDTTSWEELAVRRGHAGALCSVRFSPNGKRVITTGIDSNLKLWDPRNGQELLTLRGHNSELYDASFSPDGKLLASSSYDGTVNIRSATFGVSTAGDEWPILYSDNFDRQELGSQWKSMHGEWSIANGAARGVVRPRAAGLNTASFVPPLWSMPSSVDLRFDVWAATELVFEADFLNIPAGTGVCACFAGRALPQFNSGNKGVSIFTVAAGKVTPAYSSTNFAFERGKRYHLRVVRQPQRLTIYVDGVEVISGRTPDHVAPHLFLQASWGDDGDMVFVDNLEIRAPKEAVVNRDAREAADPRAWLARALEHVQADQLVEAEAALAKAVELNPDDTEILKQRALIYIELKQWDKAAADFAKALNLAPRPALPIPWSFTPESIEVELVKSEEVFNRVVALGIKDRRLWIAALLHFALRGKWEKAAAVLPKITSLHPSDHWGWCMAGTIQLQLGDLAEYRRICVEALERFGQTEDPTTARRVAIACLLTPLTEEDLKLVLKLVEKGNPGATDPAYAFYLMSRGMADYRIGEYARVIESLTKSAPSRQGSPREAMTLLFVAMAQQQLKQPEAARESFAKAGKMLEQHLPDLDRGEHYDNYWHDWLRCQIVRREAEALIDSK